MSIVMRTILAFMTAAAVLALAAPAAAHPHVWVTIRSQIVYAPDGRATAVRHAWTFDDMFSAFATQGMTKDKDGKIKAEDLAALAEVNVTSLKEFDYFSNAKIDGKKAPFDAPKDYFLVQENDVLVLNFTLPFKAPAKARALDLDVYDPTYFIAFTLAEKDAMTLVGAPAKCEVVVSRPDEAGVSSMSKLSESFFNSLGGSANYGAQFANKVAVKCP